MLLFGSKELLSHLNICYLCQIRLQNYRCSSPCFCLTNAVARSKVFPLNWFRCLSYQNCLWTPPSLLLIGKLEVTNNDALMGFAYVLRVQMRRKLHAGSSLLVVHRCTWCSCKSPDETAVPF